MKILVHEFKNKYTGKKDHQKDWKEKANTRKNVCNK